MVCFKDIFADKYKINNDCRLKNTEFEISENEEIVIVNNHKNEYSTDSINKISWLDGEDYYDVEFDIEFGKTATFNGIVCFGDGSVENISGEGSSVKSLESDENKGGGWPEFLIELGIELGGVTLGTFVSHVCIHLCSHRSEKRGHKTSVKELQRYIAEILTNKNILETIKENVITNIRENKYKTFTDMCSLIPSEILTKLDENKPNICEGITTRLKNITATELREAEINKIVLYSFEKALKEMEGDSDKEYLKNFYIYEKSKNGNKERKESIPGKTNEDIKPSQSQTDVIAESEKNDNHEENMKDYQKFFEEKIRN